jgi:hypothetical protein
MRASHVLAVAALALGAAPGAVGHVEFGNYKDQQLTNEVTSFMVTGEWGGQSAAPFTTPGQLAAAEAMSTVATSSLSTFVVSTGGNFYDEGVQGAWPPGVWVLCQGGRVGEGPARGAFCGPPPPWRVARHPRARLRMWLHTGRATGGGVQALRLRR